MEMSRCCKQNSSIRIPKFVGVQFFNPKIFGKPKVNILFLPLLSGYFYWTGPLCSMNVTHPREISASLKYNKSSFGKLILQNGQHVHALQDFKTTASGLV